MFGRKIRKELKELRGVIDDLRREVSFLRGQLSVKSGPPPYQTQARANNTTLGTGAGPQLRVTFRTIDDGLRMDGLSAHPHITTARAYGTSAFHPAQRQDDDEATGPVPARI